MSKKLEVRCVHDPGRDVPGHGWVASGDTITVDSETSEALCASPYFEPVAAAKKTQRTTDDLGKE